MMAVEAQQFALFDRGQLDRRVAAGVGELAVILGGFGGGFGLGRLVFGLGLARTGREQEQDAERRHKRGSHQFSPLVHRRSAPEPTRSRSRRLPYPSAASRPRAGMPYNGRA